MDIQEDYRKLLELFNDHEVEFLVVGGYALAFHVAPRFTADTEAPLSEACNLGQIRSG